jgi:hypothetical protein
VQGVKLSFLLQGVAIPSEGNVNTKGGRNKLKHRNSVNVEYEMPHHTSKHRVHWSCNRRTKKYLEILPENHSINSV